MISKFAHKRTRGIDFAPSRCQPSKTERSNFESAPTASLVTTLMAASVRLRFVVREAALSAGVRGQRHQEDSENSAGDLNDGSAWKKQKRFKFRISDTLSALCDPKRQFLRACRQQVLWPL